MHEFTLSDSTNVITFVRRDDTNKLDCNEKIHFVKLIRDTTGCSLLDAKNFAFGFIDQLNALRPDPNKIRSDIKLYVDRIEDPHALLRVMNAVRKNIP